MRSYFKGTARNEAGNILASATISVYLAGTITPASIYTTLSGAVAVNSVTSAADGTFSFYVSFFDYDRNQKFKIIVSKTGEIPTTWDNLHMDSIVIGTYAIADDTIVTTNLGYIPEGVLYEVATGKTLTISGTFSARNSQQIFSCVGTGAVSITGNVGTVYPEWFGLSDSATGANNQLYLTSAIAAAPSGGKINFEAGKIYEVSGLWTLNKAITVDGYGTELYFSTNDDNQGIVVTASNVTIQGLEIKGPDKSYINSTQIGISATGTNNHPAAPTFITGLKIKDCKIHDFGNRGIVGSYVENFDISHNEVYDHFYAGIIIVSGRNGIIDNNNVHDIEGSAGGCAYGIALSTASWTTSITSYPQCTDILVSNNIIKNVPKWEGLDTHFGKRISFVNNKVYDTKVGIMVGGDVSPYESSYNLIIGNTFISSLDLDAGSGIIVNGQDGSNLSDSTIVSNNYIYGYYDGITDYYTKNSKYIGNIIQQAKRYGFYGYAGLVNVDISHNTFEDFKAGASAGIVLGYAGAVTDSGFITNNYIDANGVDYGINANSATGFVNIREYDNTIINATTAARKYPGRLSFNVLADNVSEATSGTGEDTIGRAAVSMPATGILNIHAAGTKTNANGNKTLKFYYGASTFTFVPAVNNVLDWTLDVTIVQTEAAVQIVSWKSTQSDSTTAGNTLVLSGVEAWTEDTSAGNTAIVITGKCDHSSDVITKKILIMERKY